MNLERVLIVDVETTGLDREKDRMIEVAGVLVDVAHADVVACASTLLRADANPAEHVNEIPASLLRATPPAFSWEPIYHLARYADAFVAHRATFDRGFFPENLARLLPWCCSKFGIDWPKGRYGAHLTDLALAHGVAITRNHRALDDCLLVARVMKQADEVVQRLNREGRRFGDVDDLYGLLLQGIERGVGEPNRCRHPFRYEGETTRADGSVPRQVFMTPASFKDQCTGWVRSYRSDVYYCPNHGGPREWAR
jgi:DNA polymerase III epsilon subunit-like protein